MRVCLFSPSLESLIGDDSATQLASSLGGGDHEIVKLTNSWADADDADVYVTGSARTLSMRLLRRSVTAGRWVASAAGHLCAQVARPALIEALRAADPDVVVCPTPAVARQLRAVLRGARAPWPLIAVGDAVRTNVAFRRYDPGAKVSIVLPTYNGTRFLRQSIASCLEQTHRNIEVIVVDDGSDEPVADVVREFSDSRVVFVRHSRNQGLPASLNTGFRHSTGDLCTWTSDDNRYLPDAIEHMVRFLHTYPEIDFVYAESFRIDRSGDIDRRAVLRTRPPESLAQDNFIGACFLYTRRVYETIGEYDPAAVLAEDYDYWVRVARRFTMQRLFRRLYCYRFHDSSLTARFDRGQIEQQAAVVRRHFHREVWSWPR